MISLGVLDDHPMIAEGIRGIVEKTTDIAFCGAARNGTEFAALLAVQPLDVAIFDVRIPGENTLTLCAEVKRRLPSLKVLMLSSFFDRMVVQKSLMAGASGYALKNMSLDMLPGAIRQVHEGGVYLSSDIATEAILPTAHSATQSPFLNKRDESIVHLLGQGQSNKEIALVLGVSPHTVKLHVSRLLQRFNYRKRSQLALLAREVLLPAG
jgi:DNA-binding NarL/FixJ family response regulator